MTYNPASSTITYHRAERTDVGNISAHIHVEPGIAAQPCGMAPAAINTLVFRRWGQGEQFMATAEETLRQRTCQLISGLAGSGMGNYSVAEMLPDGVLVGIKS